MQAEHWQRIKELFSEANTLEPQAQQRFLDEACRDDPELRDEVASLLAVGRAPDAILDRPAADYLPPGALPPPEQRWIGRRIGAYELLAHIGRGGMGDVYRARRADAQYDKEVAIKLVRAGFDTDSLLQKFRDERQILASLDHPGIARLLDGGTTDEGLPYLVMDLVDGEPIDQYCESRRLSIPARLRVFRDVCAAIGYAHQHLVVHRDLKPSNILVCADGSVKVLDFGIAKLLQPDAGSAAAGATAFVAFTPAFSSPEQIRGVPVTTASDVYSLGVVLFHLLTGRSPYRGSVTSAEDAILLVCESEALRPSVAAAESLALGRVHAIPNRDLDDITLKALRKEPGSRYASVERLSDDIDRYLTGRAVDAHGGQWSYRAGKFLRRHKLEIAAALAVAGTLIGGALAATHQARLAQRAQARAERDFALVRSLANSLIFELHDSIRDLPGATAARKLLVERALQYLDGRAREANGELSLQRDLAVAYQRIGDVQGKPFEVNLGDTAGALRSYGNALRLREAVVAQHRDSLRDRIALAQALRLHADVLSVSGSLELARQEALRSVATVEPIVRLRPDDREALEELCLDYADLAGILGGNLNSSNLSELGAALAASEKQLTCARRLVAADGADGHYRSLAAVAEFTMGDHLMLGGQIAEAAAYYRHGLEMLMALAGGVTGRMDQQRLRGGYTRLQYVQLWKGDAAGALASARGALALTSRLTASDPKDAYARLSLATDIANLADIRSQLGQFAAARRDAAKAVGLLSELVAADPTNAEYRVTLGLAEYIAGEVAKRSRLPAEALQLFRAALAEFARLFAEDRSNADARLHVAAAALKVAEQQAQAGEVEAARAGYLSALENAGADAAAPPSEEARYAIAEADLGLAVLELRTAGRGGRTDRARVAAACARVSRGADAWASVREPGALSPNGFYTEVPAMLGRARALCGARPRAGDAIGAAPSGSG